MGEVEFKALGPFYGDGDETIKIGERKTLATQFFKIFHSLIILKPTAKMNFLCVKA